MSRHLNCDQQSTFQLLAADIFQITFKFVKLNWEFSQLNDEVGCSISMPSCPTDKNTIDAFALLAFARAIKFDFKRRTNLWIQTWQMENNNLALTQERETHDKIQLARQNKWMRKHKSCCLVRNGNIVGLCGTKLNVL